MNSRQPISLRVSDMHCNGCAERVATVLERHEDVQSADVSFDTETATIEVNTPHPDVEAMVRAIEQAGFKAERR